jgi:hypothetical protein
VNSPARAPACGGGISKTLAALRRYDPGEELAWLMLLWACGYAAAPVVLMGAGSPPRPDQNGGRQ